MTKKRTRKEKTNDPVAAAAAAVEQAHDALQRAQTAYQQTRETATGRAAKARTLTVGDIIDGSLEFVRRHPAAGVFAAGLVGFLLGRSKIR